MNWTSMGWLVGLLPWGAAVAYLLTRERRVIGVPHVWLWEGRGMSRRAVERRVPPVGVVLGVAAAAVGIVAAGGLTGRKGSAGRATVVLDRGMVDDASGRSLRGAIDRAEAALGPVPARVVCVPPMAGLSAGVAGDWGSIARAATPVAADTGAALAATVAELLRAPVGGAIVVLTDRAIATGNPRVVCVAPSEAGGSVGIVDLAARERPSAQAMVRLVNRSTRSTAVVRVASGGAAVDRTMALPAAGRTVDAFLDLPRLGPTVAAVVDESVVDGTAWLSRQGEAIEVEAAPGTALALRRAVEVFNRSEPAGPRRTVWATGRPLSADRPGVWITDASGKPPPEEDAATVKAHPVTEGVRGWASGGAVAPVGFTSVVVRDGRAVVAVRDGAVRQVWAAVYVGRMSRSADWVVFLANAFRWVGGDGTRYTAERPRLLGAGWTRIDQGPAPAGVEAGYWPGLYRSTDGRTVAVNAQQRSGRVLAVLGPAAHPTTSLGPEGAPLGGTLSVAAVGCLGLGASIWPGRGRVRKLT